MKHLKLFENTNWDSRIKSNIKEREEIERLLSEYVFWKIRDDDEELQSPKEIYINGFYYKENYRNKPFVFFINYEIEGGDDDGYMEIIPDPTYEDKKVGWKDYGELLQFMDDPDFVKSTKKFNL